jgi:hypothetical protein
MVGSATGVVENRNNEPANPTEERRVKKISPGA